MKKTITSTLLLAPLMLGLMTSTIIPVIDANAADVELTIPSIRDNVTKRTLTLHKYRNATVNTTGQVTENFKPIEADGTAKQGETLKENIADNKLVPLSDVEFTVTKIKPAAGKTIDYVINNPTDKSGYVVDTTANTNGFTSGVRKNNLTNSDGEVTIDFGNGKSMDGYYMVREEGQSSVLTPVNDFVVAIPMTTKGVAGADDSINYAVNAYPKNTIRDSQALGNFITSGSHNTHGIEDVETDEFNFKREGVFGGQEFDLLFTDRIPYGLINTKGASTSSEYRYEMKVSNMMQNGELPFDIVGGLVAKEVSTSYDSTGSVLDYSKNHSKVTGVNLGKEVNLLPADYKVVASDNSDTVKIEFTDTGRSKLAALEGKVVSFALPVIHKNMKLVDSGKYEVSSSSEFKSSNGVLYKHGTPANTNPVISWGTISVQKVDSGDRPLDGAVFKMAATESDAKAGRFLRTRTVTKNGKEYEQILAPNTGGYEGAKDWVPTSTNGKQVFSNLYLDDKTSNRAYWVVEVKSPSSKALIGDPVKIDVANSKTTKVEIQNFDNATLTPTGVKYAVMASITAVFSALGIIVLMKKKDTTKE